MHAFSNARLSKRTTFQAHAYSSARHFKRTPFQVHAFSSASPISASLAMLQYETYKLIFKHCTIKQLLFSATFCYFIEINPYSSICSFLFSIPKVVLDSFAWKLPFFAILPLLPIDCILLKYCNLCNAKPDPLITWLCSSIVDQHKLWLLFVHTDLFHKLWFWHLWGEQQSEIENC